MHLIEPLGFKIDEKSVKRAGLDYFDMSNITVYKNLEEFFTKNSDGNFYYATTKATKTYADISYENPIFIIFGKESKGLPEYLIANNMETSMRIPMKDESRSLNLSNAVAITLYEALRQSNFKDLKIFGSLTKGE